MQTIVFKQCTFCDKTQFIGALKKTKKDRETCDIFNGYHVYHGLFLLQTVALMTVLFVMQIAFWAVLFLYAHSTFAKFIYTL